MERPEDEVTRAWNEEIVRRIELVKSGIAEMVPFEEVMEKLRQRTGR